MARRAIPAHNLKRTRSGKVRRRSIFWRMRRWLFALGLLVVAAAAGVGYALTQVELPGAPPIEDQTTFLCDVSVGPGQCSEATALAVFHGEENRVDVSLDQVPDVMQKAVLAAEDRDFFSHSGVDPSGIARALWRDIRNEGVRQGGSTITQQYVKNVYLSNERTLTRKLKEAVMAVKFEQEYSKEEILERYLNTIYFGRGAYGVQAASRAYFGHDVAEVELHEAALLAGLIRAPASAEPYRYPEEAKRRRLTVLQGMQDMGWITPQQAAVADAVPFDIYNGLVFWSPSQGVEVRKGANPNAPDYAATEYFVEHVRSELARRYGDDVLFGGGLRIYTSLDLGLQKAAHDAVVSTLDRPDDPEGSIVAIDDQGLVRAMMGGRDYDGTTPWAKVNLATGRSGGGTGRQPGSTFKAFALSEAVSEGYSIESVFPSPSTKVFPGANGGSDWTVRGGCCGGQATLVQATQNSTNTVFAQLMIDLGPENVIDMAHRMGVTAELPEVPSVVLGSGEVSVMDMAAGFSTLANQGVRVSPRTVARVERADGTVLEEFTPEREQVLSGEQAGLVNHALSRVVQYGTGRGAQIGVDQAGKTGTTTDNKDAWFAGFTQRLTAVAWMGYAIPREMTSVHGQTVQGGNLPAQMWKRFMEAAMAGGYDMGSFPPPPADLDQGTDLNPDLTTAPPTTAPPSTELVASTTTEPPVTEPPTTEPPVTEPPTTAPPTTAAPTTAAPTTEPTTVPP